MVGRVHRVPMYAHSMIDHHTARPSTQTKVILLVGCGLVLVGMWRSWSLGAHPTQPFEYTGKGGSWESFSSKDALTPLFDAHMRPRRFQVMHPLSDLMYTIPCAVSPHDEPNNTLLPTQ